MTIPLVLIPQYFGSLVFDRRTSRYAPFDAAATRLLLRLRDTPFDAIWQETPDPDERAQMEGFFEHFYGLGFFTLDLRLAGTVLDVPVPPDHLAGPLAVHLEVVAACNLTCRHCFAGELPRQEPPLSLRELDALFAEMAAMGSFRLGLTGGEPLLRKDLFAILDLARAHGLCPCLTTNGLLITEEIAREFGKRDLVWLNVSLDGATEKSNDFIRGAGTFRGVMQKLAILSRHTRFTLAFTILRTNLAEIPDCVQLAREVGAETAVFRPLYPVGIAQHHLELMPTFEEYGGALETLASGCADRQYDIREIEPFGPRTRTAASAIVHDNYGCGAGNLVCSISVSGDVNPCSFLGPAFAAGSLRRGSLAAIWHHSAGFRSIRGLPGDGAGTATFGGGCRARALVFNGSINAPDPWVTAHDRLPQTHHPLVILEGAAR